MRKTIGATNPADAEPDSIAAISRARSGQPRPRLGLAGVRRTRDRALVSPDELAEPAPSRSTVPSGRAPNEDSIKDEHRAVDEAETRVTNRPRAVTGPRTRSSGGLLDPRTTSARSVTFAGSTSSSSAAAPHTSRRGSRSAARAGRRRSTPAQLRDRASHAGGDGDRVPAVEAPAESVRSLMARSTSPSRSTARPSGPIPRSGSPNVASAAERADGSSSSRTRCSCTFAHRGRRRHRSS